jgi:hypothetical protein
MGKSDANLIPGGSKKVRDLISLNGDPLPFYNVPGFNRSRPGTPKTVERLKTFRGRYGTWGIGH